MVQSSGLIIMTTTSTNIALYHCIIVRQFKNKILYNYHHYPEWHQSPNAWSTTSLTSYTIIMGFWRLRNRDFVEFGKLCFWYGSPLQRSPPPNYEQSPGAYCGSSFLFFRRRPCGNKGFWEHGFWEQGFWEQGFFGARVLGTTISGAGFFWEPRDWEQRFLEQGEPNTRISKNPKVNTQNP